MRLVPPLIVHAGLYHRRCPVEQCILVVIGYCLTSAGHVSCQIFLEFPEQRLSLFPRYRHGPVARISVVPKTIDPKLVVIHWLLQRSFLTADAGTVVCDRLSLRRRSLEHITFQLIQKPFGIDIVFSYLILLE